MPATRDNGGLSPLKCNLQTADHSTGNQLDQCPLQRRTTEPDASYWDFMRASTQTSEPGIKPTVGTLDRRLCKEQRRARD